MARGLLGNVALVGVGVLLGAGWSALGEPAPRENWHTGRVIEHESLKPLTASVVAWPDMQRTGVNGSCPAYGVKALDTQTSYGGAFKISIDRKQGAYTLVYCLNDFVPRVDFMSNRKSGTPVDPAQAMLWPAKIEPASEEGFDIQIGRTILGFLNNIGYLKTVDEGRFNESLDRLASDFSESSRGRAATIRSIRTLASNWNNGSAQ